MSTFNAGDIEASLTIDRKPFTAGLAAARKQAARFEKDTIEPRIEVEGLGEARTELERFRRELEGMEGDAKLDIDTAPARLQIAALEARLKELEANDIEIDVDVRRGIDDSIANIVYSIGDLRRKTDSSTGAVGFLGRALASLASTPLGLLGDGGLGQMFQGLTRGVTSFGTSIATMAPSIPMLVANLAVMGTVLLFVTSAALALAGVLGALAASLAAALAAVGALGVSFASLLAPAIALGIGAFQRFQATVEKAGTAAHALARIAGDVANTFQDAVAPAADAVFRGMADGLRAIGPMLRSLQPAFTTFGRAAGDAFRTLGEEFASPAWQDFFNFLIRSAARVTPILTDAFTGLATILRNIARAAMPFLINGLKDIASWLQKVGRSTSDIGSLREGIGGLVDHLSSWLNLAKELGRVVLAFFSSADSQGKSLVDSVADIASGWADWLSTTAGQEAVREFVADAVDFVEELVELIADFIAFARDLMPVFTDLVGALNDVLGVVGSIVDKLGDIPNPLSAITDALPGDGEGFSLPGFSMPDLPGFSMPDFGLKGVEKIDLQPFFDLNAAFTQAKLGAQGFADGVVAATTRAGGGLHSVASVAGQAMTAVSNQILIAAGQVTPHLSKLGREATQAFAHGFKSAGKTVSDAAKGLTLNAAQSMRQLGDSFRATGRMLTNAVANGQRSARNAVTGASRAVGAASRAVLQSFGGQFEAVGRAHARAVGSGLHGAASTVTGAMRSLTRQAIDVAQAAGSALQTAGATMGQMFADGLSSAVGDVISGAQALAQAARNQFHGSEPKDPSSPLRNFGQAGEALVDSYIRGLDGEEMARAMRGMMGPARRDLEDALFSSNRGRGRPTSDRGAFESRLLAGMDRLMGGPSESGPPIIVEPLAALPDGRTLGLIGGLATAGQARQPKRRSVRSQVRG